MNTMMMTTGLKINDLLTEGELEGMGIYLNSLRCYTYSFGILYKKGNRRIILHPLKDGRYKVVRTYDIFEDEKASL